MKTSILSIVAILMFNASFAKIWRVNNSAGITADFTTAQAANDAASVLPGDTIHLEPSTTSYGSLGTNKRLVWLSIGAFLGSHTGEQYYSYGGRVDGLNVNDGSANSVFSIVTSSINISAANIGLIRCHVIGNIQLYANSGTGPNNDIVLNCYCTGALLIYNGSNHNVSNNIFGDYIYCGTGAGAFIVNNVFNATSASTNSVANCTIQNNIFNKVTSAYPFTSCVVEYNMAAGNVLPPGNNNQNNITMSNVFVNDNGSTDADFVLKAYSPQTLNPASGTGIGGVDLGAYGGTTPFKPALQPAIPAIYKIVAPAAPTGSTMNVQFSTKSNN